MVLHEVHPLGDVIITLYNPNAPFAVDKPDQATTLPNGSELPPDDVPKVATDVDDQKEDAAHIDSLPKFRVSSAHLILASGYFRRMLTGPWIESLADDGIKQAKAHDWDEDVFLALMNIIHGRNRKVSRIVGLDFLAKFAAMVDYYKCHEAVELWSSCFWQQWKHTAVLYFQHNDRRNLTLRLLISWVFSDSPTFSALTQHVLWHSTKPLQTFELPIPAVIIGRTEQLFHGICTNDFNR